MNYTLPSMEGLHGLSLDDYGHHMSEVCRMERESFARSLGLHDPAEYSKRVQPGNVTNNITHNIHPPSGPFGKLLPAVLIGAAIVAAGAVGAWCLIPPVSKSIIDRSKETTVTAPPPVKDPDPQPPVVIENEGDDFDIRIHTRLIPPGGES